MIKRYLVTGGLGVAVTFGLFMLMRALITLAAADEEKVESFKIEFVRVPEESSLQTRRRELPDKDEPEDEPPPPELSSPDLGEADASAIQISAPPIDTSLNLSGKALLGTAASDTDVIPLVRVEPMYPRSAMQRGVEGYVTVQFTISKTGTVVNPKIIDADPKNVFDQAAISAIKKWKYNPKVQDGVAVDRPGVTVTLEFNIRKNQ